MITERLYTKADFNRDSELYSLSLPRDPEKLKFLDCQIQQRALAPNMASIHLGETPSSCGVTVLKHQS